VWRFVWSQVRLRRSRTGTLAAAILLAAVSFVLLTSAVSTSELQIRGTVAKNWDTAYDILVRPPGSLTAIERTRGLVADNALSGIFGGIRLEQWRQIMDIPGVDAAAPIANVGYILLRANVPVSMNSHVNSDPIQIFRVKGSWLANHGLSEYPAPDTYLYYTREHLFSLIDGEIREVIPHASHKPAVCSGFFATAKDLKTPFDLRNSEAIYCESSRSPDVKDPNLEAATPAFEPGEFGILSPVSFPVLVAGIDPIQEAKLVGLQRSVIGGRFLSEGEAATIRKTPDTEIRVVPLLASSKTYVDEVLNASIERLEVPTGIDVPATLASRGARSFLKDLRPFGQVQLKLDLQPTYDSLISNLSKPPRFFDLVYDSYRTVSPVTYRVSGSNALIPTAVSNPVAVWRGPFAQGGFLVPTENLDVQFRVAKLYEGSIGITKGVADLPMLHVVGQFDPSRLPGFSALTRVPLESYVPPELLPADSSTEAALAGGPLLPTMNVAGYLQQPPLMFTTLEAAQTFMDPHLFNGADSAAPISVIRVRVAGVNGPDAVSRERVRRVAEAIQQKTGLTVDITAGSSLSPLQVQLPPGRFGQPPLSVTEGWTKKGVAFSIVSALDRKSLILFVLVLLVSTIFLANGAFASVRSRRVEIGTLMCLGWGRGRIFRAILGELALVGMLAGAIGAILAILLAESLSLRISASRSLLVAPVAVLMALMAGALPAWQAARGVPLDTVRPKVIEPKRSLHVRGVARLAVVNLLRVPGRVLLGAGALLVGVAALVFLLSINFAFHGSLVGTLLGQVVSVQARPVDYISVSVAIIFGGLSVADVLFLNLRERSAELVTLRTSGWQEAHLAKLITIEGLLTGGLGSLLGAGLGLLISALVGGVSGAVALAALLGGLAGMAVVVIASLVPGLLIGRLTPSIILAEE
jgi:putative ABC transport system permease protein